MEERIETEDERKWNHYMPLFLVFCLDVKKVVKKCLIEIQETVVNLLIFTIHQKLLIKNF